MTCRIAFIADIHASSGPVGMTTRKGEWGDVLLRRTIHRLNRYVRPDVTVVLGDVLNDHEAPDAMELLNNARAILGELKMPWLAIPGNHDPDPDTFYTVFDRVDFLDVKGTRIVTFDDTEQPNHNARRETHNFERMARHAADHNGPLVAVQHVPPSEPRTLTPYGYTNHAQVAAAMREHGYTLAVAGHFHAGIPLQEHQGTHLLGVRALCEAPYAFDVVTIDGDRVTCDRLQNQLPPELCLNDYHSHTQFAYCSQNVSLQRSPQFAELIGLNQLAFTEHSGQLYFECRAYWDCAFGERGIHETDHRSERMGDYWQAVAPCRSERVLTGLEVDADFHGNLVVNQADFDRAEIVVGAVHWLRELKKEQPDPRVAADEFLRCSEGLCRGGVDILAHPFRVFSRSRQPKPLHLIPDLVKMLKAHGVAAEINFHSNEPVPELFAACLAAGVKISFGGDAHELYEVGQFHPQLDLLKQIGFNGDLTDILLPPLRAGV